jgi:hypothetical protein
LSRFRSSWLTLSVTRGLDPRVHPFHKKMDCRVKPGSDAELDQSGWNLGYATNKIKFQARERNLQSLTSLMEWLQATSLAVFIHKTSWAFTTVELVHVIAVALVVGTIAIVDLRLLGLVSAKRPFTELSRAVLPYTWAAFVLAVAAGSLLFISQATKYFASPVFWIKMSLIVLAGINMLIFELITARGAQKWNLDPTPPLPARLAGAISLTCWALVVAFGRWISFTLPQ